MTAHHNMKSIKESKIIYISLVIVKKNINNFLTNKCYTYIDTSKSYVIYL